MFNTSSLELPIVCIKKQQNTKYTSKIFHKEKLYKRTKEKNENKQLNTYNL